MALIDPESVCSKLDEHYLKKWSIYEDIPLHAINGTSQAPYNSLLWFCYVLGHECGDQRLLEILSFLKVYYNVHYISSFLKHVTYGMLVWLLWKYVLSLSTK